MNIKNATLEITTKIGCSISCKYCPQKVLISKYFEMNMQEKRPPVFMSFETFKTCIDKIPREVMIDFAGMCEPWLNPECTKMLEYAVEKGHEVRIYSTLVGMEEADIDKIAELNIRSFVLHAPDEEGNSHIRVNERYKNILKKLMDSHLNTLKAISVHGIIHSEIRGIISEDWVQDNGELIDRAGNLDCEGVKHRSVEGNLSCNTCGWKLNNNILLPDGRVLLCCNDYGMRHVLGNLLCTDYEELFSSEEYKKVKDSMMHGKGNILCNSCSNANTMEMLTEKYSEVMAEKNEIYRNSQTIIRRLGQQISQRIEACEFYKRQAENYQKEYEYAKAETARLAEACEFYKRQAENYQKEYEYVKAKSQ